MEEGNKGGKTNCQTQQTCTLRHWWRETFKCRDNQSVQMSAQEDNNVLIRGQNVLTIGQRTQKSVQFNSGYTSKAIWTFVHVWHSEEFQCKASQTDVSSCKKVPYV